VWLPLFFSNPMFRQSGFSVLTLLLMVAVLLASLAFVLIGSGPNVQGQLVAQKTVQLVAQAQLLTHRITKCATDYPNGDNGTGLHKAYPLDANPGALAVTSLICPGSNQNLWSGVDGVYAPAPVAGFAPWTYTNASPAVISIQTTLADTYSAAISAAVARLGPVAASTTTSVAGDTLTVKVIE
jgi:type II secretory pathway pseudopilin PulG